MISEIQIPGEKEFYIFVIITNKKGLGINKLHTRISTNP